MSVEVVSSANFEPRVPSTSYRVQSPTGGGPFTLPRGAGGESGRGTRAVQEVLLVFQGEELSHSDYPSCCLFIQGLD